MLRNAIARLMRRTTRGSSVYGWMLALGIAGTLTASHGQNVSPGAGLPALTEARQILQLSRAEAQKRYPVLLKGVVTVFDSGMRLCFVQDSTAGVYLYNANWAILLKPGDFVEVTGVTSGGGYSPIVLWASVKVEGRRDFPPPRKIALEELATGRFDAQWVEIQGTIRSASTNWGLSYQMANGSNRLGIRLVEFSEPEALSLVGAVVRARGVIGTHTGTNGQITGFQMFVSSLGQIQVEEPAKDPFSRATERISELLGYSPSDGATHQVRIRGVVTYHAPGRFLFITDDTGGIKVKTKQAGRLDGGELVDVAGFSVITPSRPGIEDAVFRITGKQPLPSPVRATLEQLLSGQFDSARVTVEGRVAALDETEPGYISLIVEQNQRVFRALLDHPPGKSPVLPRLDSRVRITGVCSAETSEAGTGRFSLWVKAPEEIMEVNPPPRAGDLSKALPYMVALFGAGVVVVAFTRRSAGRHAERIQKREAALKERYAAVFQHAHDLIYTHELDGRFTSINQTGVRLLGYTEEELLKMNIEDIVAPDHTGSLRDALTRSAAGSPRSGFELEMRTKSGSRLTFEVNSRLQYEGGKIVGVQGIARDITERKKAEAALHESEQQLRESIEQRERLARNLHDGIIQSIYAVGLNLEDCSGAVVEKPRQVQQRLKNILGDLNGVIRDVRNFILGLEAPILRGQEFKAALKSLIVTLGESQQSRFVLQIDPVAAEALTSDQATQLLHVAREAVSNGVRHSGAQKIVISLGRTEDHFRFEVQDDGAGFDPAAAETSGHGLKNMAARADDLGGTLKIISSSGDGARIMLDIPRTKPHFT